MYTFYGEWEKSSSAGRLPTRCTQNPRRVDGILYFFFLNVRPAVFWRYWWNAGGGEHRRAVGHLKGADEFERENIGAIGTRGTQVAGNNGGLSEADRC